jgi:hypothetical protein
MPIIARPHRGGLTFSGDVLERHHFPGNRVEYEPKIAPDGPDQGYQQARLKNQAIHDMDSAAPEAGDHKHGVTPNG